MWVDRITRQAPDEYIVINDSKTPSGQVHVGSLRGVLIHDTLFRQLRADGRPVIYSYGIDDYDPMDGLPADAGPDIKQYMGVPLCNIPAPRGSDATDMADHYISEFLDVFRVLGVGAQIYRMRDVYRNGLFNDVIDRILCDAKKVRDVYESVSGAKRPDNWYPFQVICESCGKIGTTQVTNYSEGVVEYICKPDLVSWAQGCGHTGSVSPFDGNGKLPWKLEWAAKWHEFLINIEGAGKDHCTKGGSRDVASLVQRKLFNESPPINVPYEFFLIGGAKMSSSKGLGASARVIADFLPPEIIRYLMIRTDAKKAVNFSIEYNNLVKLFNDYDSLLLKLRAGQATEEERKLYTFSLVDQEEKPYLPANFQLLTSLLQLPHIDAESEVVKRLESEAGQVTEQDLHHLRVRLKSAKYWLDNLASNDDKFEIHDELPTVAENNSHAQNAFLNILSDAISSIEWTEKSLQTEIFEVARNIPISQKTAFEAIYRVLLGKERGPKAGALISYLDRNFVLKRFREVEYSIIDFVTSVSVPWDSYEQHIEARKEEMDDVVVQPELYLCLPTQGTEKYIEQFKFGYGVAALQYTYKGKRHTDRVTTTFLEGCNEIDEQATAFLTKLKKIVGNIFGIDVEESVGVLTNENTHIETSPGNIRTIKGK